MAAAVVVGVALTVFDTPSNIQSVRSHILPPPRNRPRLRCTVVRATRPHPYCCDPGRTRRRTMMAASSSCCYCSYPVSVARFYGGTSSTRMILRWNCGVVCFFFFTLSSPLLIARTNQSWFSSIYFVFFFYVVAKRIRKRPKKRTKGRMRGEKEGEFESIWHATTPATHRTYLLELKTTCYRLICTDIRYLNILLSRFVS